MQAILILAHRVKLANMELKIKSLSLYMGCFTGVAVLLIILFKNIRSGTIWWFYTGKRRCILSIHGFLCLVS